MNRKQEIIFKICKVNSMLGTTAWGVALNRKTLMKRTADKNEKALIAKLDELEWKMVKKVGSALEVNTFGLNRETIVKSILSKEI